MSRRAERIARAVSAVLPPGVLAEVEAQDGSIVNLRIGSTRFSATWLGEGWLSDLTHVLKRDPDGLDVVVARQMSPGAAAGTAQAGLGWVDETGGAELVLPGLVLARTGQKVPLSQSAPRWNPSVIATAEALLLGIRPTVSAVHEGTGLSTGAVTAALKMLTEMGHLEGRIARGRNSARQIVDAYRLLQAYAAAAQARRPRALVRVGVVGDLMDELNKLGRQWDSAGVGWAATGGAAAGVLAPYLTQVTSADVFVDASTPAELHALAEQSGLQILEGGRVTLRSFPTAVSQRLSTVVDDMRVAAWPRVFADLRVTGVRGEEAAEHLREVMVGG